MIGTGLTKQNSSDEYTFTGDGYTGPVLADITCPDGVVRVSVDSTATVATVRVRTDDPTGPAATAVKNTRIHQTAERLTVIVPPLPPSTQTFNHGGVIIGGSNFSTVQINGVTYSGRGGAVIGATGVEVLVTLPAASGVKYVSENGSLHAHGVLAALKAEAINGSITAESVGRMEAEAGNGSLKVGTVTEWIDAEASNGSVRVDHYSGSEARIRVGNGSIKMIVARAAAGRITAKTGNGSIKLYGVETRTDLDITATAGNGTVTKI